MLILTLIVAHSAISLTAARWWMRPLLLGFDRKYRLRPCKESDFYFFCWTWSIILLIIGLYTLWRAFIVKISHPLFRAVLPQRIRLMHEREDEEGGHECATSERLVPESLTWT